MKSWYRIENALAPDTADVWIYDEISFFGVSAQTFVQDLVRIQSPRITLHLNSPGGNVFDGWAIYNALRYHPAEVTVRVEGLAASAASFIAMAGERVLMASHSMLMIHDAWGATIGNAEDHRKQAEVLDKLSNEIAGAYAGRAGGTVEQWRDFMLDETWLSDQEAVDLKLADAVDESIGTVAARFDLSKFRNPPKDLTLPEDQPTLEEPAAPDAGSVAAALSAAHETRARDLELLGLLVGG